MASAAFGETLQFITDVKLAELEKRRQTYEAFRSELLSRAAKVASDPVEKLSVLLEGIKAWPGSWSSEGSFSLVNIEQWVIQAKRDPTLPHSLVECWIKKLEGRIHNEGVHYDYARLFGNLLIDWIKSTEGRDVRGDLHPKVVEQDDVAMDMDFQRVSRKETLEQKARLESMIFNAKEIDVPALEAYLQDLFSSKDAVNALEHMRQRVSDFGKDLRRTKITAKDLQWCIKSLLATDLLSDAKQTTLREFSQNDTVMKELASVLNMQLASLPSWQWPKDGVLLEPRRHLNGKTRFFVDSEILTSLLLQYLGVKWSITFKSALKEFLESKAWKDSPKVLNKVDLARRAAFIEGRDPTPSANYATTRPQPTVSPKNVTKARTDAQRRHYFMNQLPSDINFTSSYNDSNDADDPSYDDAPRFDGPVDLKQSLLHILSADVLFNKTLHGQCTVVRTDLEWFGPSLPFQTINTVLKFFGMPPPDLQFIQSFLACPLIFTDDPVGTGVRTRKRGVPISHALSTLCGELILFCMDFAVNQKTDGMFLYRIHDDFWFWDADSSRCAIAWAELQRYAALTGMRFNEEKTGSIHVGGTRHKLPPGLPQGEVRWGFLRMDGPSGGKFVIDQRMVDDHIVEMRRQLAATTAVFSWAQAYNKYMAFFVRNCGAPAKVYSRAHIDDMINTVARIQHALFPDSRGSYVGSLASTLAERYGMQDVPLGWYLWPIAAGGLGINDPLISLLAMRKDLPENLELYFEDARKEEERLYEAAKEAWDAGSSERLWLYSDIVKRDEEFFSMEEYSKGREESSAPWSEAYDKLLQRPTLLHLEATAEMSAALEVLGEGIEALGSLTDENWYGLTPYWKWVISLHHEQMMAKFGSLAIVDPTSIPVGMVGVFKNSRMRWEQ